MWISRKRLSVAKSSLTQPHLVFAIFVPTTDYHKNEWEAPVKMEHFDQENNEDNAEWLLHILKQVQLEQFYVRIRDHLQISRISHFDYVTPDDLEKVGIILILFIQGWHY